MSKAEGSQPRSPIRVSGLSLPPPPPHPITFLSTCQLEPHTISMRRAGQT